jgi:N6-L-threonylcarbamoyladenine synthase
VQFPRALPSKDTFDFSFSGLKTAVRSHLLQAPNPQGDHIFSDDAFWPLPTAGWWEQQRNDILASFQKALVDAVVGKTRLAVKHTQARAVAVVGGVACNATLRRQMLHTGTTEGFAVFIPPPRFCTDNAAMIACAAYYRYCVDPTYYQGQHFLDLEAQANLSLPRSVI